MSVNLLTTLKSNLLYMNSFGILKARDAITMLDYNLVLVDLWWREVVS